MEGDLCVYEARFWDYGGKSFDKSSWAEIKRGFLLRQESKTSPELNLNLHGLTDAYKDDNNDTDFCLVLKDGRIVHFKATSADARSAWLQSILPLREFPPPLPLNHLYAMIACLNALHDDLTSTTKAEGIFRLSGRTAEIRQLLKQLLEDGSWKIPSSEHVHNIASALKYLLRRAPETLLTERLYDDFVSCGADKDPVRLQQLISKLPPPNLHVLSKLLSLCAQICEHRESTQMSPATLAVVLGPTLLKNDTPENLYQLKQTISPVFQALLHYRTELFPPETPPHAYVAPSSYQLTPRPKPPKKWNSDEDARKGGGNIIPTRREGMSRMSFMWTAVGLGLLLLSLTAVMYFWSNH